MKQQSPGDDSLELVIGPTARETGSSTYARREQGFRTEADQKRVHRDRLSTARLFVFLASAGAAYLALTQAATEPTVWWSGAVVMGAVFVQLVRLHRGAERARRRAADLARLNQEAAARVEREWALLPPAEHPGGLVPPVARDLGLFGSGSLFQLLGTARTPAGRRTLARWLLEPALAAEVVARQDAVRELAPELEARQALERDGLRSGVPGLAMERFLVWAEEPALLQGSSPLVGIARVLSGLMVALGTGHAVGLVPALWIALIPVIALVWVVTARRTASGLTGLEIRAEALSGYEALFTQIERSAYRADRLANLRAVLHAGGGAGASEQLLWLRRIASMAEVRYSPMIYLPLQLFFLWDVHVLYGMDRWRRQSGRRVRGWLDAVGEMEALSALAGLAFDNPDWTQPIFEPAATQWKAEALGHPLLASRERVANDVRLGPPGRLLLVTGSNMSGKSTLLRTIGVNVTLAHAGGPVASRFALPPTRLGTSFVIEDSLQSGVSYFMAELQRLKAVLEEAAAVRGEDGNEGGWRFLFLLDEILKGTNSGERQIAVRRILSKLLANGAAGAISTHDLALADLPTLREKSVAVHFRERHVRQNGHPRMEFDYALREGPATTSNALALLEIMGIEESG